MQVQINNELTVVVLPDEQHEWLLSTKDVAEGYGLSESGLRSTRQRNSDELEEGKHFITMASQKGTASTLWTKRGVVRLGFFIKTPMAKEFRDWAEDYIIEGTKVSTPVLPQTFAQALALAAEQALALELVAPKVATYDAVMDTKGAMQMQKVAKVLGLKPQQFPAYLRYKALIFKRGGSSYEAYQKYIDKGYFIHKLQPYGEDKASTQVLVTPKGIEYLKEFVHGYDNFHKETKGSSGFAHAS